jgi:WD40 repeat protein
MKVWDADSYGGTILRRAGGALVAIGPDGKVLAAGSIEQMVSLFLAASGQGSGALAGGNALIISFASLSGGNRIVVGLSDRTVRVWDLKPLRPVVSITLTESVSVVAVSPDGRRLLAANFQNDSVSLIDLANGAIAEQDLRPGKIDPAIALRPQ